uniref:Uncharacterized protein n=1 Tax=Ascaris lumbricoides TaxID=6252 RepID=A0A9J2Q7K5_ASCLU
LPTSVRLPSRSEGSSRICRNDVYGSGYISFALQCVSPLFTISSTFISCMSVVRISTGNLRLQSSPTGASSIVLSPLNNFERRALV